MSGAELPRAATLLASGEWAPIPGCPGRWRLRGPASPVGPAELLGVDPARVARERSPRARDEVLILPLLDGGLISYRRPDGAHVHTLGDAAGFARKLRQLRGED